MIDVLANASKAFFWDGYFEAACSNQDMLNGDLDFWGCYIAGGPL